MPRKRRQRGWERPGCSIRVATGATGFRRETAAALVAERPTVIRGNASEILALSGAAVADKGVDASGSVDAAESAAMALARAIGAVVAVTGAEDFVTDDIRACRIGNGHPLVRAALRGWASLVQLRDKTASDAAMVAQALQLLPHCRAAGVPLVINDRLSVAQQSGPDGLRFGLYRQAKQARLAKSRAHRLSVGRGHGPTDHFHHLGTAS